METQTVRKATGALLALDQYMRDADYAGPDPYDGLNSPLSRLAFNKFLRQALIQSNKRSPIELRGLLRIAPVQMSKTLGLVLSAFGSAPGLFSRTEERAERLRERLLRRRNADGAWGYEFDVQMRWGWYPSDSSNVIATSFAVEGLLADSGLRLGETWATDVAEWIEGSLAHNGYITYAPSSDRLIHNASLLGASTLLQCAGPRPLIGSAIERTLAIQAGDGSFPYGDEANTSWIDSFHTAYVLLALQKLQPEYPEVCDALDRGLAYWLNACFDGRGGVKYFATDEFASADVHTNATTLIALSAFADRPDARKRLDEFIEPYLAKLGPDGYMTNRKHGKPYMRWELAHQLRALAEFVRVSRAGALDPE